MNGQSIVQWAAEGNVPQLPHLPIIHCPKVGGIGIEQGEYVI